MASTADRDELLDAIISDPADDVSRVVYADWLEQHSNGSEGDPNFDRATFIRLQVQAARLPEGNPDRAKLNHQANTLFTAHRTAWEEQLKKLGVERVYWGRGFPTGVSISADNFIRNGEKILTTEPITKATISDLSTQQIAIFAGSPHLANLTYLNLRDNRITDTGAQALAGSPHLTNLTYLDLGDNRITDAGAQALAGSPHLANLTYLNLWNDRIGEAGARALAGSPHMANLTHLYLGGNGIGDTGAQALAGSPHLANLTHLGLGDNRITDTGAQALAGSPHMANLTHLGLGGNRITDTGAQALAGSPHMANLTHFGLGGNRITDTGARALADSPHLTKLTYLDLAGNWIGAHVLDEITRTISRRGNGTIVPPP